MMLWGGGGALRRLTPCQTLALGWVLGLPEPGSAHGPRPWLAVRGMQSWTGMHWGLPALGRRKSCFAAQTPLFSPWVG